MACRLGADCSQSQMSYRSVSDAITKETSPPESTEKPAAAAKAAAADDSADDVALLAMRLAIKLRGLED